MPEICQKCGLPNELCVCETIAKETQRIVIKREKRKFGKIITVVAGIDPKQINIWEIAKKLKEKFACGGTVKNSTVELQGDHVSKLREELIKLGFPADTIE